MSQRLSERYGKGWSEKTLRHCLRAAETFSESDIVSAVQRQFSWTHLKSIMYIPDELARQKRITIDATDYYIDLLFYHRGLRRLVAIYYTQLPDRKILAEKLQRAIAIARNITPSNICKTKRQNRNLLYYLEAIIPKVSNRFFIYGIMMSKKGPSVLTVTPTDEREMTDTRPRNKINNNSCARH